MEPSEVPYYEATVSRPKFLALVGDIACDVCVVGAGYAGLSAALHLAGRGREVVVLEAGRVGGGASGRNGGQLIPGFAVGMDRVRAAVGEAEARRLWRLALEGAELVEALATRPETPCDFRRGHLTAAVGERHRAALNEAAADLAARYGYALLRPVGPDEIGALVASRRYVGGLLDEGGGHLNPLKLALGLAGEATARGARIAEDSPVLAVEEGERPLVRTATARVRAGQVVLAANSGNGALAPALAGDVLPAATYMIATAPLGAARAAALIRGGLAVADTNYVLDYFRPSADGRLLFGGGISYAAATPPALARRLRRRMLRVFPQLADVAVEHAWSGTIDLTRSRLPQLGRRGAATWFAHGFSGHGIALAVLAGRLIAEAIDGEPERFEALGRLAHRAFPGGRRLRVPLLAAGALWYRMRDLVG